MRTITQILIKEVSEQADFYPFSLLHSIAEIRCGALRLIDKIKLLFPDSNIAFIGNTPIIASLTKRENIANNIICNVPTLVLNSNFCINHEVKNEIIEHIIPTDSNIIFYEKQINNTAEVATYYPKLTSEILQSQNFCAESTQHIEIKNGVLLHHLYDAIYLQEQQIVEDSINYSSHWHNLRSEHRPDIVVLGNSIKIGKDIKISPNVMLDASIGSIIIDDNASIMSGSVIVGPCYIGKKTIINPMSYIHPGCSFGPSCKIGGEVECSTFQGFSNKQHHGFIGHSYISEWINIGAGTSNSDLKNNYSKVKIQLPHKTLDTNQQFMGCLIGDHTKISINCSINTGSVIGCCVNLSDTNLTPKFIPSFQWVTNTKHEKYEKEKAIETIKIMMERRNKELIAEEKEILKKIEN